MVSGARRQIIGGDGGAPINKTRRRRRPQIDGGGAARPAHGSTYAYIYRHTRRVLCNVCIVYYLINVISASLLGPIEMCNIF